MSQGERRVDVRPAVRLNYSASRLPHPGSSIPHPSSSMMKLLPLLFCSLAYASTTDWPLYRHDAALTGVSPGKGTITNPEVKWEYYLGAPFVPIATAGNAPAEKVADLDGDGTLETFSLTRKTIEVFTLEGRKLWSFTVQGHPLGGNVRVCKLFPNSKGKQIISFSSRMDTGEGQGYCFSFDEGVTNGSLAWTTGPLTNQYAPTLVVDDVDGDGCPDIVTAPHYKVQIFNGQTGALQAEVPEAKGRNYGMLLTRPRRDRSQKDIFVISDFVLHVECVRYEKDKWVHAWGHKYFEDENAPRPEGRQKYIRVGPNPIVDLDGDGKDDLCYMLVDATIDDQWHLIVRDCESGNIKSDLPGIWLWSIDFLSNSRVPELLYTRTRGKRPRTYCDLHIGRFNGSNLVDLAMVGEVRPLLMNATLPPTACTIADEGLLDILKTDLGRTKKPNFFFGIKSPKGAFEDKFVAASIDAQGKISRNWEFQRPGHRLNLLSATTNEVTIRDLTASELLTVDARSKVTTRAPLGKPPGFSTVPIALDLDKDGRTEIVVQNAFGEIVALKVGHSPKLVWSVPGVAMNPAPGYSRNGGLCPQAADLFQAGTPNILFAAEDKNGLSSLVCLDARGKIKWRRSFEGCPWGGLQAGVDHWTIGHFRGDPQALDVYVDLHRRSKNSGEGWLLRGDTGEVLWKRKGIIAKETAMPFGGGIPSVADLNGDQVDDLVGMFYTVYGAISGLTGEPIFPPAYLPGPKYFGKWLAYSEPTVADLTGDGSLKVYLNSRSYARGGYAAVHADGLPLWAEFHNNDEGSSGLGPVGDFDGDSKVDIAVPVLNGTLLCLNGADGSHKWRAQTPVLGDVIAADINSDGIKELIFGGNDGKIHSVNGKDGHEIWAITASGQPIVADVDGDGFLEVLAVGNDGTLRSIGQKGMR
jgi:outer membrane protein assembly factor BamB